MFKNYDDKFPPYDLKNAPKELVEQNKAAVFSLIGSEMNVENIAENGDYAEHEEFDFEYASSRPKVYRAQKRSPLKTIIPAAAAAAVVAIAAPIGINYLREDGLRPSRGDVSSSGAFPMNSDIAQKIPFQSIAADVSVDFKAKYVRTSITCEHYSAKDAPRTLLITKRAELEDYCRNYEKIYDLNAYGDKTNFHNEVETYYGEDFFEKNDLILVVVPEYLGLSGCKLTELYVPDVSDENGISMMNSLPSIFPIIETTSGEPHDGDEAAWHIVVEVRKTTPDSDIFPIIDGNLMCKVPPMRDVVKMTNMEAETALQGLDYRSINYHWGSSDIESSLSPSGFWYRGDTLVIITYDWRGIVEQVGVGENLSFIVEELLNHKNDSETNSEPEVSGENWPEETVVDFYMPEYEKAFNISAGKMTCEGETVLDVYKIEQIMLADVDGDRLREICAVVIRSDGAVPETLLVYDPATGEMYEYVSIYSHFPDYRLKLDGKDVYLVDEVNGNICLIDVRETSKSGRFFKKL